MKLQPQITARNLELSEFIKEDIKERAEKLDKFYDRIMHCRVVVEVPHQHMHEGISYNVRIDITVPGSELVIKREPNIDLDVAIRDAFDAARRKLEDFSRKKRGDVKRHEEATVARVSALFPDKGYGFLTTPDSREIYFHKNSVLKKGFMRLKVGTEVRYVEEEGEKGPQASTVSAI